MTLIKSNAGLIEQVADIAAAGVWKTTPKALKGQRPAAPYGVHGVVVTMKPIPGLTPKDLFKSELPFVFQVPPTDTFGDDDQRVHDDYMTVGDGEHSSPASGPSLRTLSFTTLFLDWQPTWSVLKKAGWTPDPKAMVAELRRISRSGRPFHLLAHRLEDSGSYDVNYAATLRDVHWEMQAGEDDALYITVNFTEFRMANIDQFLAGSVNHPALPVRLTVRTLPANRNTLAKLATFYYGDSSKWNVIAAKNGLTKVSQNTVLTAKVAQRATITVGLLPAKKPPLDLKTKVAG
jgi:hypothetical protein